MDYEAELAVVIGRRTRYADEAHALESVAGYTIFNDITARDDQKLTANGRWASRSTRSGRWGPALVTTDEIPDPGTLDLSLSLNGREMQHSNTRDFIFSIPFVIAYLSQAMTLEPGDVIATGTPAGPAHCAAACLHEAGRRSADRHREDGRTGQSHRGGGLKK